MRLHEVYIKEAPNPGYGMEGKPEWYDRAVQLKLNNPNISVRQIARQVGVNHPTVYYWLTGYESPGHATNLKRPSDSFPFTIKDFPNITSKKYFDGAKPEWYDQALQMAKAGETFAAIGKKFGATSTTIGSWLVKGRKDKGGKIINPDAVLEPRKIIGQKLDVDLINSFIRDWNLTDKEIIELVADDKGPKVANQVKNMLPTLRQKLNPGTQVIDKTRSVRDPDITGFVR